MTVETTHFLQKLLKDLRDKPEIPVFRAAQAVLLGGIQMKMDAGEVKEVLDVIRMEYGMERQKFSAMMMLLIKKMPAELRNGDLSIPVHWES